jgi:8-oxo-dGTP pyrophosphatase MutT (NUDIX family)
MPQQLPHGVVLRDSQSQRRTDFLYRVSIKCLVRNEKEEVLVVKESGRTWWDLPGGGMDHGESIKAAIAREMKEEVNLEGEFTYRILEVEEPALLNAHNLWQIRLIYQINPTILQFSAGEDGDEVVFMHPDKFQHSDSDVEQRIYRYNLLAGN